RPAGRRRTHRGPSPLLQPPGHADTHISPHHLRLGRQPCRSGLAGGAPATAAPAGPRPAGTAGPVGSPAGGNRPDPPQVQPGAYGGSPRHQPACAEDVDEAVWVAAAGEVLRGCFVGQGRELAFATWPTLPQSTVPVGFIAKLQSGSPPL